MEPIMTVKTASGSKFYIGTTAAASNLSQYESDTYVEVGEVEDMGQFGDTSSSVTFAAIGDGRIRKSKGARDAGTLPLVVGRDPADTGQAALEAAEATNFDYNFKVVHADAINEMWSDTVEYFRGLVMSKTTNVGTNDNIVRKTFNIGINTAILDDPSIQITS
jgi:hypothetical protein